MADQIKVPALESFPHNQIIAKSKINVAELDEDIKTMIADFIRRYQGYKLKWNETSERTLMATSNVICQNIYDYYVDKEDQEVVITTATELNPVEIKEVIKDIKDANEPAPAPAPNPATPAPAAESTPKTDPIPTPADEAPKNKDEKILHDLFTGGTTGITRSELSKAGFDTELVSIRGGRVGKYELRKEPSELTYKLSKI
jgi:ribosomal protein L12E/L44/L45/RPP1/RPP2